MIQEHDPYAEFAEARNPEKPTEKVAAKVARKQQEKQDVQWLMSTKQGRRVVARLIEQCGVYRTSFTGTNETFFKEGMRNIGLFLVAEISRHAPDTYAQMINEAKAT